MINDESRSRLARSRRSNSSFIISHSSFPPAVSFLLHFPSARAALTLSSTVPYAVRTFLTGGTAERRCRRGRHACRNHIGIYVAGLPRCNRVDRQAGEPAHYA